MRCDGWLISSVPSTEQAVYLPRVCRLSTYLRIVASRICSTSCMPFSLASHTENIRSACSYECSVFFLSCLLMPYSKYS